MPFEVETMVLTSVVCIYFSHLFLPNRGFKRSRKCFLTIIMAGTSGPTVLNKFAKTYLGSWFRSSLNLQ